MHTFKLLDTVIQGVTFVSALLLLFIFGAQGYFFWINLCLVVWILISMSLNLSFIKPLTNMRKISTAVLLLLFFLFGLAYLAGTSVGRMTFYYRPLSLVIIVFYFFMSITELNKMKSRDEIDLDF